VIANGGADAERRARLAKCVLQHVAASRVPVGVGSAGVDYAAQPHEYSLDGYDLVEPIHLQNGPSLLLATLKRATKPLGLRLRESLTC
jgi:hypothetical protein